MARRSRQQRSASRPRVDRLRGIREFLGRDEVRRAARRGAWTGMILLVLGSVAFAAARTERFVLETLNDPVGRAALSFAHLPTPLEFLAREDLIEAAGELLGQPWTGEALCRELAQRLSTSGWVEKVIAVRRIADGRFELDARYRIPAAMVAGDDGFILIDAHRVRLPGVYRYDPTWTIIQGVEKPPPAPGREWEGEDIRSGAALVELLVNEPFAHQIAAVLVENLGRRVDSRGAEIELATDRDGGRILWGSPIGAEIAENSAEQKLAILRANFRKTGRVDAGRAVIGVFTFPDRFSIPG